MTLESAKALFQVFTDKLLFVEWILQILRAVSIYFLKVKASLETDEFAENNEELDMRTVPSTIKKHIIYDEEVLKMRWDLCSSCEFLTESNKCEKCGCFMKVKHKLKMATCPIGKWDKYEVLSGVTVTS
tara:strand:+ start:120 stop:506 length:387 start_codon:yes stop_codon:yes gene_type:complete